MLFRSNLVGIVWVGPRLEDGHVQPAAAVEDRLSAVLRLDISMWDGNRLVERRQVLLQKVTLKTRDQLDRSAKYGVLTVAASVPILADIQTYFAGSMAPVPRKPGISQFLSIQKKRASTSREKTSVGRLFASMRLVIQLKYGIFGDRKSTRLNSSHSGESRMPSSA